MKRRIALTLALLTAVGLTLASCRDAEASGESQTVDVMATPSADTTEAEESTDALSGEPASSDTEPDPEETDEYTAVPGQPNGVIGDGNTYVKLKVHNILQEPIGMPFGCEAVSVAIALSYYGYDVAPVTLFVEHMDSGEYGVANPFYEYVGDPRDDTGYGCYAPCAVRCANSYLESVGSERRARDISGSSIEEICEYIRAGIPVVIWGTLNMSPTSTLAATWRFNGNPINWYNLSHCVMISGIYKSRFLICDPMVGQKYYSIDAVEKAYNLIYTQALVIE